VAGAAGAVVATAVIAVEDAGAAAVAEVAGTPINAGLGRMPLWWL